MLTFTTRKKCPICGESDGRLLIDLPFSDPAMQAYLISYYGGRVPLDQLESGRYQLMQCAACRAIYQTEILLPEGLNALYETWIDPEQSFQKKFQAPLSVRVGYARQIAQVIKSFSHPPHDLNILDFGMGWGAWLMVAKAYGVQAVGLELSPKRVAYAQQNGLMVVSPDEIQPQSYHMINAEQVFEHLDEPQAVLASCYDWLKPNGLLRIAVPNGAKMAPKIEAGQWTVDEMATIPLEHINTFTPKSLQAFGKNGGFELFTPPLVLPQMSLNLNEVKQFFGVMGYHIVKRLGIYSDTIYWFKKKANFHDR